MGISTKSGLRTYTRELRRIARQAPWMASKAVNDMAFHMRGESYPTEIRGDLKLRSTKALRSIQVVKGPSLSMMATVGTPAKFLRTQEFGDDIAEQGEHGVPLPAASAAKRRPGRSAARGKNKLKNIHLTKFRSNASRAEKIEGARRMGGVRYVRFTSKKGHTGIYRINGKRRPTKVWDLSKKMVHIDPQHMMRDAAKVSGKKGERFMRRHLVREVLYSARKIRQGA